MGPLPPFERRPEDENESHEKPTWPWEKAPEDKEAKKKPDSKEEKEPKKKPEQPKEEKKEPPKKEEKPEKPSQEPEEETHERRATLVEQSIALVAKYEEEPIPRDANTLARLMIAHQVVHLNSQLEQANSEHPLAPEEIEATLDYITKLDAKFQDPEAKTEPAVEQSYQAIIQLAEATLAEETDLKTVVESLNNQSSPDQPGKSRSGAATLEYLQSEAGSVEPLDPLSAGRYLQPEGKATSGPDFSAGSGAYLSGGRGRKGEQKEGGDGGRSTNTLPDDSQEEFDRRKTATKETIPAVASASALIYLITHLGRKKPKSETSPNISGGDYSSSDTGAPPPQLPSPTASRQSTSERSEQFTNFPASTLATASPEQRTTPSFDRERVSVPSRRPSILATAAVATAIAASHRSNHETPHALTPEARQAAGEPAQPRHPESIHTSHDKKPQHETPTESGRKIEHMPLLQLLSMAENVDIGHGRYLRREFETGHIDKEGLVKILKAHSKGRDYHFEFRQQASRFAKLKETSPEFLHQTTPIQTDSASEPAVPEAQPESAELQLETNKKDTSATVRPLSLAPPTEHDLPPELASSIHQPEHTGRRLVLITVATLAGLALIGWLAVTIFNALS